MNSLDKLFEKMGYKRIPRLSPELRNKTTSFIHKEFPEIENLIEEYSNKHKLDKGDVSAEVIIGVIIPELEALGGKE